MDYVLNAASLILSFLNAFCVLNVAFYAQCIWSVLFWTLGIVPRLCHIDGF